MLQRAFVEVAAVAWCDLADAENRGARIAEHPLEARASGGQRQRPQIFSAIAENVEGDEGNPPRGRSAVRLRQMDAILQPLKSRRLSLFIQRNNFAVEDDGTFQFPCVPRERRNEIGKLRSLLVG